MIDINKYIIQLLELNNEVTIPGIGGFYLSRTETNFDSQHGTFYPSAISVTFNPFRLSDDGVLRDVISDSEGLEKHMAEYELQKFIIKIKQGLSRNHRFELEGIGTLESDDMANVKFKSTDNFILNKANIGLKEVISKPREPNRAVYAAEKKIVFAENTKQENSVWKWLLISLAIIIIVSLIMMLAVQYYMPELIRNFKAE
ncbi:hypothetical protein C3K47_16500 [Solitalea longa]|uniref:CCDC81-like prokaryotic HU domain-containing protein n=1 Tax=Solitalea longa TaxID=2079460 RepID=A0A2S4ZYP9_9SPHI|nr:hypothetical protein [Solitalea longa]POY35179.1 hypothetical protein C3K47_16500 [Solitalea longa]